MQFDLSACFLRSRISIYFLRSHVTENIIMRKNKGTTIKLYTKIDAPIQTVFDHARSIVRMSFPLKKRMKKQFREELRVIVN